MNSIANFLFAGALVAPLFLVGCANEPGEHSSTTVNSNAPAASSTSPPDAGKTVITEHDLDGVISTTWTKPSLNVLANSAMPSSLIKILFVMVPRALKIPHECGTYDLVSIRRVEAGSTNTDSAAVAEIWTVEACGQTKNLRIDHSGGKFSFHLVQ